MVLLHLQFEESAIWLQTPASHLPRVYHGQASCVDILGPKRGESCLSTQGDIKPTRRRVCGGSGGGTAISTLGTASGWSVQLANFLMPARATLRVGFLCERPCFMRGFWCRDEW